MYPVVSISIFIVSSQKEYIHILYWHTLAYFKCKNLITIPNFIFNINKINEIYICK